MQDYLTHYLERTPFCVSGYTMGLARGSQLRTVKLAGGLHIELLHQYLPFLISFNLDIQVGLKYSPVILSAGVPLASKTHLFCRPYSTSPP